MNYGISRDLHKFQPTQHDFSPHHWCCERHRYSCLHLCVDVVVVVVMYWCCCLTIKY